MRKVFVVALVLLAFVDQGFSQTYTISTVVGRSVIREGGAATEQPLANLSGVAVDAAGNVYIALPVRNRVYKVTPAGVLTTFAGTRAGFAGDGGPATQARLRNPQRIAVDSSDNIYISDAWNRRIRKVTPDGTIVTIAGTGTSGYSGDNGPATSARLSYPAGMTVDRDGNIYFADRDNERVRKISTDGTISTVAGNGTAGFSGDGGPATSAKLNRPTGVAVDSTGNIYVTDQKNYRIRKVSRDGIITTIAGTGSDEFSGDGGAAIGASIGCPSGITIDAADNIIFVEECNQQVRKISPAGIISRVAGTGGWGLRGDGGPATNAIFRWPWSVAVDSSGNIYVADTFNARVRKITTDGTINTIAGSAFGATGDGGPAPSAILGSPYGLATDNVGNLYIADRHAPRIRKVSPNGTITTIAGIGTAGFSGDGGAATAAQLRFPRGVAADSAGNVYIADTQSHRIRKVSLNGTISTIAGTGTAGFSGDGGAATTARFNYPSAVALDSAGNLYVADRDNRRVRKIDTGGIVTTIAGTGVEGSGGDGGPAASAQFRYLNGIAVDVDGNIYVADADDEKIRKISTDGKISTVSETNGGHAVFANRAGVFYSTYYRVYKLRADGTSEAIGGTGIFDFNGDGGSALSAALIANGIAVNGAGEIFISDHENYIIRKLTPTSTDGGGGSSGGGSTTPPTTPTTPPTPPTPSTPPSPTRPTIGYAILQANSGQASPTGLLIFSSVQDGIIVSEASVPASPTIRSAMLFAEFSLASVNTGVAIANPNTSTATAQLELWSADGKSKLASTTLTIDGRRQTAKLFNELFPDFLTSNSEVIRASLIVRSSIPVGILTLRLSENFRGDSVLTTLPVTDIDLQRPAQPVYFPQIADGGGFSTQIILQNPTQQTMQGSIDFYAQDGSNLSVDINGSSSSTLRYSIAPGGLFFARTDGAAAGIRTGSAIVRPDGSQPAPSGTAIFSYQPDGLLVSEAAVPASLPLRLARMYVEYNAARNTGVALSAPTAAALRLQVKLTGDQSSGGRTFTTTVDVRAGGQKALFVSELFPSLPSNFRGVLEISGSTRFAVITLRQTTTPRGDALFTTLPVADPDVTQPATLVFPHLAIGGGYQTELILLSNAPASGSSLTSDPFKSNAEVVSAGNVSFVVAENGQPLPVLVGGSFTTSYGFVLPQGGALPFLPNVSAPKPVVLTTKVADARVGLPYTAQLIAGGGVAPYGPWVLAGSLPPGLTFNAATGTITGTPALLSSGTAQRQDFFTITVTDSTGQVSETRQLSITTRLPALTFPLPGRLIPGAVVNQPYDFLLPQPNGGIGPFYYQLGRYGHGDFGVFGGGFPPPGITVTPDGHVSGTPKARTDQKGFGNSKGVYTFNICVVDNTTAESDCQQTSLTVIPPFQRIVTVTKAGTGKGSVTIAPPGVACGPTCDKLTGTYPDDGITKVTLTATKGEHSIFTGWGTDCAGTQPCQLLMNQDHNVVANFQKTVPVLVIITGSGTGRVVSTPPGIDCRGGTTNGCQAEFPVGVPINLTPIEDPSSTFAQWDVGCNEPTGFCIFTLSADEDDHGVVARFNHKKRSVTVLKAGNGTGSVKSNPPAINCGTGCTRETKDFERASVELTAQEDPDSVFVRWEDDCSSSGTNRTCTLPLDKDKTATARFDKKPTKKTVTVLKAGTGTGSVTSNPSGITCGSTCSNAFDGPTVTLTAQEDADSVFVRWEDACSGASRTCTLQLDANKTATARFDKKPTTANVNLTVTVSGEAAVFLQPNPVSGSASCNRFGSPCTVQYERGTRVTISARYSVTSGVTLRWSGACADSSARPIFDDVCSITMDTDKQVGLSVTDAPASYRFSAGFTATSGGSFAGCQMRHSLSGTIYLNFTGRGTASEPYRGTMSGNGRDVLTVISGRCYGDTISGNLVGTVSGSNGRVEAHGTVSAAGTVVYIDFVGTISGNTLPGTLTIRNEFFSTISGSFSFDRY